VLAALGYDDAGRRTGLTYGNGDGVTYGYDAAGRLASQAEDLAGATYDLTLRFSYNPAGQIVQNTRSNELYSWTGHGNTFYRGADGMMNHGPVRVGWLYAKRHGPLSFQLRTFNYPVPDPPPDSPVCKLRQRKPSVLIRQHVDDTGNGYELDDLLSWGTGNAYDLASSEILRIHKEFRTEQYSHSEPQILHRSTRFFSWPNASRQWDIKPARPALCGSPPPLPRAHTTGARRCRSRGRESVCDRAVV
jgi:YD repeat-containing protein